jgi:hypothetical protein
MAGPHVSGGPPVGSWVMPMRGVTVWERTLVTAAQETISESPAW